MKELIVGARYIRDPNNQAKHNSWWLHHCRIYGLSTDSPCVAVSKHRLVTPLGHIFSPDLDRWVLALDLEKPLDYYL